jgi:uncharacterized membrane protein
MTTLAIGLGVFLGLHAVPTVPPLRSAILARVRSGAYRGLFSLLTAVGLGLTIYGKSVAPWIRLYDPAPWGHTLALWTMPVAFFLLTAAYVPSWTRHRLRHPMLLSILLWAGVHLLANGDMASLLLFGGFGAFALLGLLSHTWREERARPAAHWWGDVVALLGGACGYAAGLYLHWLAGHPVG